MRRVRVLFLLSVAVSLCGLLGCGGGGEPALDGAGGSGGATTEAEATSAGSEAEACELVSREDAGALFGQPASPDSGPSTPGMFGQCLWTWDTESSNQLLQFHIWTRSAYAPPEDSEPLALGEEGYIRTHPMAGVDIAWIEGGRMLSLSYSTVGPDAPEATSKTEQMKELARRVASRL